VIVNTSNVDYAIINAGTPASFTLPSGTNRYVLFMIGLGGDGSSYYPNTVTIAGTVATMIVQTAPDLGQAAAMWGANIPDSVEAGASTITVDGTGFQRCFIAVFTGVSRDPVVDSDAFRNGSSSSDGDTLTVDCVGGGWVHDIVFVYTEAAKTAGANQTVIYNSTNSGVGVSYKSGLAHGTTSMAWTWTDARSAHAVVSLRPYRPTGGVVIF
jgi:hypothetical protein